MRLDILGKKLQDAGLGTMGVDIFAESMSADVLQGILIRMPLEGIPINAEMPGYYEGRIQVVVRAQLEQAGATLADQVKSALHTLSRRVYLDGLVFAMQINQMIAETLPIRYRRSDGNGIEWSINFEVSYVLPS